MPSTPSWRAEVDGKRFSGMNEIDGSFYLAEGAERGEGFLRKLKDQWNQRAERPKNYGQKRNWSAVGAEQVLEPGE